MKAKQTKKEEFMPIPEFKKPGNKQQKMMPLGFVLKYDPPVIGLVYKKSEKDSKKNIYTIHLNNLIYLSEPEDIVEQLYCEHQHILDPHIIKPEQIYRLTLMLVQYRDEQLENMNQYEDQEMEQNYQKMQEEAQRQMGKISKQDQFIHQEFEQPKRKKSF